MGVYGSLMRLGPPSYAILGGLLYRASGDFAQPNPFAGYMNHIWPLAAGLLLAALAAPTTPAAGSASGSLPDRSPVRRDWRPACWRRRCLARLCS